MQYKSYSSAISHLKARVGSRSSSHGSGYGGSHNCPSVLESCFDLAKKSVEYKSVQCIYYSESQ